MCDTREQAHKMLGLPCRDPPYCDTNPRDKLYCTLALARGYDSIQIARAHSSMTPELVICNGGCKTVPVTGTTALDELWRAKAIKVSITDEQVDEESRQGRKEKPGKGKGKTSKKGKPRR